MFGCRDIVGDLYFGILFDVFTSWSITHKFTSYATHTKLIVKGKGDVISFIWHQRDGLRTPTRQISTAALGRPGNHVFGIILILSSRLGGTMAIPTHPWPGMFLVQSYTTTASVLLDACGLGSSRNELKLNQFSHGLVHSTVKSKQPIGGRAVAHG